MGEGRCERCKQPRPLFHHEQNNKRHVEHDCSFCTAHEDEWTKARNLCPRCWSEEPLQVDHEAVTYA